MYWLIQRLLPRIQVTMQLFPIVMILRMIITVVDAYRCILKG